MGYIYSIYNFKEYKYNKFKIFLLKLKKNIKNKIINYWAKIILIDINTYYEGLISICLQKMFNEPSILGNIFRTIYTFSPLFVIDYFIAIIRKNKIIKENEKLLEAKPEKIRKVIDGKLVLVDKNNK